MDAGFGGTAAMIAYALVSYGFPVYVLLAVVGISAALNGSGRLRRMRGKGRREKAPWMLMTAAGTICACYGTWKAAAVAATVLL